MNSQNDQPKNTQPKSLEEELAELRHFKDSVSGLWCVDQDPKGQTIEWIRENTFQLT